MHRHVEMGILNWVSSPYLFALRSSLGLTKVSPEPRQRSASRTPVLSERRSSKSPAGRSDKWECGREWSRWALNACSPYFFHNRRFFAPFGRSHWNGLVLFINIVTAKYADTEPQQVIKTTAMVCLLTRAAFVYCFWSRSGDTVAARSFLTFSVCIIVVSPKCFFYGGVTFHSPKH